MFSPLFLFSQNLVPNPSFETISSCPTDQGQLNYAIPWFSPTYYGSSPMSDLFDTCEAQWPNGDCYGIPLDPRGYQYPRTGNAMAGVYVFADYEQGREYISVQLNNPLGAGKKYCIGFYVSLANFGDTAFQPNMGSRYAIDRMGVYLSDTIIHLNTIYLIPVKPQIENPQGHFLSDTLNWMLVSGTYSSKTGGEQYITIGNFYSNDSTNYIKISNSHSHLAYYYIDDVYVMDCNDTLGIENYQNSTTINVFPNPATDYLTIETTQPGTIEISNIQGKLIKTLTTTGTKTNVDHVGYSSYVVDVSEFPSGVYIVEVKTEKGVVVKKFVKE